MPFDTLEFRSQEATNRAEEAYHDLRSQYEDFLEFERHRTVGKPRFKTLIDRITENGAPYGAHTIVYREDGQLLLVRHEHVDQWVLPGGMTAGDETFRDAAIREVGEEAGVSVGFDGLAFITRVQITSGSHSTVGVVPVFAAMAETLEPSVDDPDGEISAASWFETLPDDTRDRSDLEAWREAML